MFLVLLSLLIPFLTYPIMPPVPMPPSPDVVISQVYGGGGNSGAAWRNDFVELFNRSNATVTLTGWSIQYASATGTTWSKVDLTGNLGPGKYFLIQLASGGASGALLPTPDATSSISMAATAGKVALVHGTALLPAACPSSPSFVDLVGYGANVNCFEGSAAATAPSASRSLMRANNGCTDTDSNSFDFASVVPLPRNLTTAASPCQAMPQPTPTPPPPPPPVEETGGSIIVFPFYSSSITSPTTENTLISLTNTDETRSVTLHLVFTINESTSAADRSLTLSPNQTATMLASEIDPGVSGSMTAIPVDSMTGCPIRFDGLAGTAQVKLASQQGGSLQAIRLSMADGQLPACGVTADIRCLAPRVIGGTLLSFEDGYRQMLVVTRIGGSLGALSGAVFNDAESVFSFSLSSSLSQLKAQIDYSFPRTTPRLSMIVPAGRSGWFKLSRLSDGAIVGAMFTHNPRAGVLSVNSGRNLHQLGMMVETISIPVVVPS